MQKKSKLFLFFPAPDESCSKPSHLTGVLKWPRLCVLSIDPLQNQYTSKNSFPQLLRNTNGKKQNTTTRLFAAQLTGCYLMAEHEDLSTSTSLHSSVLKHVANVAAGFFFFFCKKPRGRIDAPSPLSTDWTVMDWFIWTLNRSWRDLHSTSAAQPHTQRHTPTHPHLRTHTLHLCGILTPLNHVPCSMSGLLDPPQADLANGSLPLQHLTLM